MYERGITTIDVKEVVRSGNIVEEYPDDKPFPSYLLLGYINNNPLHVVVAIDNNSKKAIIITVYKPDVLLWKDEFKKRK